MKTNKGHMKLGAFCGGSYHQAGWRHPDADNAFGHDFSRWVELARKLEAAKFDMMFIADTASPSDAENPDVFRYISGGDSFEPMTLLAALSAHTTHLGLAATIATSYRPPYDAAREILSLDRISGGRVGWNIVTGISPDDAAQYADQTFVPQEQRYARGEEFVDVVLKLWDSVEPGAYPRDKEGGAYKDLDRIHLINHVGRHYRVRGPLKGVASAQGRPLLIQAGQSEEGRAMASRVAEAIFTAQSTFEQAQAFRDDIRRRAVAWGRNPDHVKVMPGALVVVGETREEAQDKWAELDTRIDLRAARARLQLALKAYDLSGHDLDAPFPDVPPESVISRGRHHVEAAKREGLTLREVLIRSSASNAHFAVIGTVKDVTDELQHWFEGGACDGFNIMPAVNPVSFEEFIERVVPELQRRGLFRTEYEGRTLRENLQVPADLLPLLDAEVHEATSLAG
ncbi:LLM class flavin-dependent oxidoreductase [Novosphingobium sp. fls2-241-R2A-195]|jgi:FMN-dependent oxidoreductase (nitrilotriacetate monooxygenase family)|uniref:LLM class flavin-dependent oxidoreductase n=1 Tax=Novosphingobium sp. fls2-241-R2A-195 TaxID=3040296 RepID=UPI00254D2E57|nr:LLM class flavin-dependent oxidoreductase [Novosphingobium sp. fls2-241-R2A-195]